MQTLLKRGLVILITLFGLFMIQPIATAATGAPRFAKLHTTASGNTYSVVLEFRLSASELALVKRQQFVEIDFGLFDTGLRGDWQDYHVLSNMPGAQKDVPFEDTTPTPAVTGIRTAELLAEKNYQAGITWQMPHRTTSPTVAVDWIASHWANPMNLIETGACTVGLGQPGWCIFGIERDRVTGSLYGRSLPVNGRSYSIDPGVLAQSSIG